MYNKNNYCILFLLSCPDPSASKRDATDNVSPCKNPLAGYIPVTCTPGVPTPGNHAPDAPTLGALTPEALTPGVSINPPVACTPDACTPDPHTWALIFRVIVLCKLVPRVLPLHMILLRILLLCALLLMAFLKILQPFVLLTVVAFWAADLMILHLCAVCRWWLIAVDWLCGRPRLCIVGTPKYISHGV